MLGTLWQHRTLVFTLVKRDLKIRYKSSAFGFLWSFGRPLALMMILWLVFSHFVGVGRVHPELPFPLQLLAGLLPWMFLTGALFEAQNSIFANENIVKKISVPSIVFPTASVLSNLVHTLFAFVVLFAFVAIAGVPLGWEVALLPFLFLLQALMLLGIALILSSLNVFYRDVGSISEIVITMWFYLTPILYPAQMVRDKLKSQGLEELYYLYLLNPMTPITCAYRRVLFGPLLRTGANEISDETLLLGLGASTAFTILVLAIGLSVFKRMSVKFADEL